MENILDLIVTSHSEIMQQRPPLKIRVIKMDYGVHSIAFERPVQDIELKKEDIKELIKSLTDLL